MGGWQRVGIRDAQERRRSALSRGITAVRFARDLRRMRPTQLARADQFRAVAEAGVVVFLGDSITEWGLWSEWFPGVRVLNRGIAGETTTHILERLEWDGDEPHAVFLLAGTNDLTAGDSPAAVAGRLNLIVDRLRRAAPRASLHLQSVMPRTRAFTTEIRRLNAAIESITDGSENTRYLDLWPALADASGALRAEFTYDGLHLTGAGYAAWVSLLRPWVEAAASGAE